MPQFEFEAEQQMMGWGTPDVIMKDRLDEAVKEGRIESYKIHTKFPDIVDADEFLVVMEFSFVATLAKDSGGGSMAEATVWGEGTANHIVRDTDAVINRVRVLKWT